MSKHVSKVRLRNKPFTEKVSTRIWKEIPSTRNLYIVERCLCHGYDLLELMRHRGYVDMIYLLLRGELPTLAQLKLLETLMVGLCNPGPRHPASRAAMNAGVGKTDNAHILPIAMSILGGAHLGGSEVQAAMRFLRLHIRKAPEDVVKKLIKCILPPNEGDYRVAPGFGTRFGDIDTLMERIATVLLKLEGAGDAIRWGAEFAEQLHKHGCGWLTPGIAAATFLDLGFHPRAGAGLYQLVSAPGLLAHGLEFANKPITAMPFVDKEHYLIDG